MRGFKDALAFDACSFTLRQDPQPQRRIANAAAARRANLAPFTALALLLLGFFSVATCVLAGQAAGRSGPAASVDPLIGTGKGPGGSINLFPGPTTSFGMAGFQNGSWAAYPFSYCEKFDDYISRRHSWNPYSVLLHLRSTVYFHNQPDGFIAALPAQPRRSAQAA